LISLKAGGSGLNLHRGRLPVITSTPGGTPPSRIQGLPIAPHRIGQKKVVTGLSDWSAAGTIEEKILQLKQKKKDLVNSVLSEDMGGAKNLSKDDLDDLFRLD
jgi:SNF2 family DNA or RNA helicase